MQGGSGASRGASPSLLRSVPGHTTQGAAERSPLRPATPHATPAARFGTRLVPASPRQAVGARVAFPLRERRRICCVVEGVAGQTEMGLRRRSVSTSIIGLGPRSRNRWTRAPGRVGGHPRGEEFEAGVRLLTRPRGGTSGSMGEPTPADPIREEVPGRQGRYAPHASTPHLASPPEERGARGARLFAGVPSLSDVVRGWMGWGLRAALPTVAPSEESDPDHPPPFRLPTRPPGYPHRRDAGGVERGPSMETRRGHAAIARPDSLTRFWVWIEAAQTRFGRVRAIGGGVVDNFQEGPHEGDSRSTGRMRPPPPDGPRSSARRPRVEGRTSLQLRGGRTVRRSGASPSLGITPRSPGFQERWGDDSL